MLDARRTKFSLIVSKEIESVPTVFTKLHACPFAGKNRYSLIDLHQADLVTIFSLSKKKCFVIFPAEKLQTRRIFPGRLYLFGTKKGKI